MKLTHFCTKEYFMDRWNKWAKIEGKKHGHYFVYGDFFIATISTPDQNYILIIKEDMLDKVTKQEIVSFGNQTTGELNYFTYLLLEKLKEDLNAKPRPSLFD